MRLIDADALRSRLIKYLEEDCFMTDVLVVVDTFPTIEAKTVRHGRWIEDGCYNTCSLCGSSFDRYDDGGYYQDFDYCPKCGQPMDAKDIDVPATQMDGGAED